MKLYGNQISPKKKINEGFYYFKNFHTNNSQGSIDLFPEILNRNGSMDLIPIESFVKTSEETKS
jgi:hypothetical protein